MKRKRWIVIAAVILAVTSASVLLGFARKGRNSVVKAPETKYQVQKVTYPKASEGGKRVKPEKSYLGNLGTFYEKTMSEVLCRDGENVAYSPVNLYLCMAMLAEMTDGSAQRQLLDALGQESEQDVREQSKKIWESVYESSDTSQCVLGDSVWLNEEIPFKEDVLEVLADNYYASAYHGKMGTEQMDREIQNWLNSMTGNALKEQTAGVQTKPDSALMLLSTAYFYDQWSDPFPKANTKKAKFYQADGSTAKCQMMKSVDHASFYQEKDFTSTVRYFEKEKQMHIFLPAKGVTVEEMMERDMEKILRISTGTYEKEAVYGEVTLHLPKFDIATGNLDLIPALKNLGVTDVLEPGADFSRLVGEENQDLALFLDKAEQSTRAAVDEDGCSVASFTKMDLKCGAAMVKKKCTIKCNRPFLFVISTGKNGIPVFAGVVNNMRG